MSQFNPDTSQFSKLKGKVVVLTGGANGIGASTVRLLHEAGASVVFGDVAIKVAEARLSSLSNPSTTAFIPTDVTKYADNVALFKTALQKYGRVDHALACAGIIEQGKWFDPELTLETVEKEETRLVLDVNLVGTCMFARIAVVYLKHEKGRRGQELDTNKSCCWVQRKPRLVDVPVFQALSTNRREVISGEKLRIYS